MIALIQPYKPDAMNPFNMAFCLTMILLVPFAAAGLALIHQGLGRSRSAGHAMLATLCVLSTAAIVFVLVGSSLAGFYGGAFRSFSAFGSEWNWLGSEPLFAQNLSFNSPRAVNICLQMFAAGLAAMIPLSTGTDRWRLAPICLATAVFAGFLYPLFSHWVWAGGWLARLPENFHLPAFLDAGGGATIQVTGGIAALSVAWILRARRGKYMSESTGSAIPTAIPGHNIVMVLFGCLLALVGWLALDAACSILFYGLAIDQVPGVLINATLCASAACMAAVAVTQYRYRKPDASISANGFVAGLVAGSSSCAYISPLSAIFTGLMAGLIVTYTVELLELKLLIDDPGGAISVHLIAGIWGILATGLFVRDPNGLQPEHILSQLIGIATLLGLILPVIHGANLILNRFVPYRVDRDGDWQGMDIRELGSGAYPEFVIHADEFIPRS